MGSIWDYWLCLAKGIQATRRQPLRLTCTYRVVAMEIQTSQESEPTATTSPDVPLCVDLDGTLTYADLLLESFFLLLRRNPFYLFMALYWLSSGKANLKEQIARRVTMNISSLPYNDSLVSYLKSEREKGRSLYLCTGTNQRFAEKIAEYFGFFSGVLASSEIVNFCGKAKASALTNKFGERGFDYCGNENADIPVWHHARNAIVVGNKSMVDAARKVNESIVFFEHKRALLRLILREMRVYQWVKNVLVFVPLLASHQFTSPSQLIAAGIAFLSFCLCASSVYLLNDMLDLESDRSHMRKRNRPFASGHLPLSYGVALLIVLLAGSFCLAALLPLRFMAVLVGYYALTLAYSFVLKRLALVDVFSLAGLYTIRIVAGGAACGIALSGWLMFFSVAVFLSLAMVKRYAELDAMLKEGKAASAGRGYITADVEMLRSLGTNAGYLAAVVLALYISSAEISTKYSEPNFLWLLVPLLLFWISRLWLCAFHGEMHDDPIIFAFKDRVSVCIFPLSAACIGLAL